MDTGSVLSEPISPHHRAFAKQKSASMTILNPKSCSAAATAAATKYNHHQHDHLETKMSNIESAGNSNDQNHHHHHNHITQCSTIGRRRKITSLAGSLTARSARSEAKELRSALQDREAAIQNLRIQLCLGKLPRPTGPPLDESEKPVAEQRLTRLNADVENKKIKIRNLKSALDKLDITDNIDIRIRQAELEYALGREELQMLSLVEEARALQARLEKSKPESQTLYSIITSGVSLSLHAVHATSGRWAPQTKTNQPGMFVEWALEGDGLYKGDRILEVNGKIINCKTKDEFMKIVGNSGKCQMVVLRKKPAAIPQKQLDQEKENNMRLQHRISYLEEQVKELQSAKEEQKQHLHVPPSLVGGEGRTGAGAELTAHITSISISSPSSTPTEKPLIFQRGNYITTLVGGKPIELQGTVEASSTNSNICNNHLAKSSSTSHITKTLIKEARASRHENNDHEQAHDHQRISLPYNPSKSLSASKISINSDFSHHQTSTHRHRSEKDRLRERYEKMPSKTNALQHRSQIQARSVEHLNQLNGYLSERRRDPAPSILRPSTKQSSDMRSVKSLDLDSENDRCKHISDTVSEARSVRPTPPKKPLRLSLQRAQSLQTVELPNPATELLDRKRPMKRAHITQPHTPNAAGRCPEGILIENCKPLHTSSLGRTKPNV